MNLMLDEKKAGEPMKYIVDKNEAKKIDAYTIQTLAIPDMVLMERAALAVFQEVKEHAPKNSRCLVVIEGGNNGGDGLAVARLLAEAEYSVTVCYPHIVNRVSEAFNRQLQIVKNLDITVTDYLSNENYDVVIDGMFGVGLSRNVEGEHEKLIEALNQMQGLKIAIDVPSGIDAGTGKTLGIAFWADITVTFGFMKKGLLLLDGAVNAGKVVVADIGFPNKAVQENKPFLYAYDLSDFNRLPKRMINSNKGTYGKVAVIAGSLNVSGAAYFAAKAAYVSGCGLVKVITHACNRVILQTLLPEAMLDTYEDEKGAAFCVEQALHWADVAVIGPGIGTDKVAQTLLETLLNQSKIPMVIDADGLNLLANDTTKLNSKQGDVVITPHMKEMERLTGKKVSYLKEHPVEEAVDFTKKYGAICVLKDARTIVSDLEEGAYINVSGNSGMSTGGAGDVLAGVIGSFIAQGLPVGEAARIGVYVHGLAGDAAKKNKNEYSMLANDIIDGISHVLSGGKENG